MKRLKYILLCAVILFAAGPSSGQTIKDPTVWKTEVKKKNGDNYQLIFHLALKEGWHVYAKMKGMDESLIVPAFTFDKNDGVTLNGDVVAKGILESKNIEGIGPISWYMDKVLYVQNITAKKGAKVSGTYIYQTCNDNTCLPPVTKKFSVTIK